MTPRFGMILGAALLLALVVDLAWYENWKASRDRVAQALMEGRKLDGWVDVTGGTGFCTADDGLFKPYTVYLDAAGEPIKNACSALRINGHVVNFCVTADRATRLQVTIGPEAGR